MDASGNTYWNLDLLIGNEILNSDVNIFEHVLPEIFPNGPPEDHGGDRVQLGDGGQTSVQVADIPNERPPQMAISEGGINGYSMGSSAQGAVGATLSNVATCSDEGQRTEDGDVQDKRKAPSDGNSEHAKRGRAPNWTDEETKALLESKLDVLMKARSKGKRATSWSKDVSQHLLKKNGSDRSFKSYQQRWDTIFKDFKAICEHDSKIYLGGSNCIYFWDMNEDQRSIYDKLPKVFSWEWYKLMKCIVLVEAESNELVKQNTRPTRRTRSTQVDPNIASTSTQNASTIMDPSCSQDQVSTIPLDGTNDEDNLFARIAPFVSKQVEVALQPLNSFVCALANSMGNAIPYGAQVGVANLTVDTINLAHEHELEDL